MTTDVADPAVLRAERKPKAPAKPSIQPLGLTITDLLDEYRVHLRARNLSAKTQALYVGEAAKLAAFLKAQGMPGDVALVRRDHIEAWIASLQDKGLGESSVSIAYRSIRPFWGWLVSDDSIDVSPMAKMRPPKVFATVKEFPTVQVVQALLDSCAERTFNDRRDRALFLLMFDTGIRRGEVENLRLADVDPNNPTLSVIGKARTPRLVALSPMVAEALAKYLRLRKVHPKAKDPALFIGAKGALLGNGILQVFRRRGAAIGHPELHPHAMRHAFTHQALSAGMNESDVMRLAGWKSPAMVRRYGSALAQERALDAARRLSATRLLK